ncbi:hypothetical protein HBI12_047680 [Parastagonospora nodorum]|nr:hypothetical protein HBI12_047680 [Parastagonospora nodorum]KAH5437940.1 hypothetical protein HBI47_059860 [Parastagonospora nodorum]
MQLVQCLYARPYCEFKAPDSDWRSTIGEPLLEHTTLTQGPDFASCQLFAFSSHGYFQPDTFLRVREGDNDTDIDYQLVRAFSF